VYTWLITTTTAHMQHVFDMISNIVVSSVHLIHNVCCEDIPAAAAGSRAYSGKSCSTGAVRVVSCECADPLMLLYFFGFVGNSLRISH